MADQPEAVVAPSVAALDPLHRTGPTRRQVVLGAGAVLGIAAIGSAPFLSAVFASVARMVDPAVGVVAPLASRYPDLLDQLAAGVRAGLAAGGQPDAPVFARIAASSAPSSVAAAARELVEREKVDLVLVYTNPTQAALLGELAQETGVSVVVVDPSAHIVTSADADARVLSHSLGYWQSVWALGSWSAQAAGSDAYVISSLYESGFDILNAFEHGLVASGGRVIGTSITHVKPGDVATAVAKASASGADSLFVAASGAEAEDILAAIAADKTAAGMQVLLPGIASDRMAVARELTAYTALTWPVAETSPFEMLGRDVGELVAGAVKGGAEALPQGETALAGARGDITLDLATGRTDVPVSIHSVAASAAGADRAGVTYTALGAVSNTSQATALADRIVPELRTGWLDVYGSSM